MNVSNPFALNCTKFLISDINEMTDIIEVDETDLDLSMKLFMEYDFVPPQELIKWIPCVDNPITIESLQSTGLGIHGSIKDTEFLKFFIPSSALSSRSIKLYGPAMELRVTIELVGSENLYNPILTFINPPGNGNDSSLAKIHVNEVQPHSDIFLGTNLGSRDLGFSRNYECKLAVNAGIHGTTYVDRNGHLMCLGEYYAGN